MEGGTKKGRGFFTCETRETFGVHMQSDQAICSRCIGTALPSPHPKFVSIFAFIFFQVFLGATLNPGEVSACSDLSSLHSYFSTGIVRLRSPLHKRCHLSVRMPVLRKRARVQRFPPQTKQWYGRGKFLFFVKRSTLCRSLVSSARLSGSYLLPLLRRRLLGPCRFFHWMLGGLIVPGKRV